MRATERNTMTLKAYFNADVHTRTWNHITRQDTGRTLELAPGEEAELDLPDDFEDPYLTPVAVPEKLTKAQQKKADAEAKKLADTPDISEDKSSPESANAQVVAGGSADISADTPDTPGADPTNEAALAESEKE
jgi:hypothetical protein